jgi:sporulation protein YlmC with PRC-barrel domain
MTLSARIATLDAAGGLQGTARPDPGTALPAEVVAASSLEGETVLDSAGETVGEIEEIMLDVAGGRVAYAVLAVGGFLGIGEKYFPVPWSALTRDTARKCFVLGIDKDRLADAPGFDKDHWPSMTDREWAGRLSDFYGTGLT